MRDKRGDLGLGRRSGFSKACACPREPAKEGAIPTPRIKHLRMSQSVSQQLELSCDLETHVSKQLD